MKRFLIILFVLLILGGLVKLAMAWNIGVAQPNGTNIGVMQYETTTTSFTRGWGWIDGEPYGHN